MTAIKICGLTRREDVALASELGAALLGFNFVEGSPRRLSVEWARAVVEDSRAGVLRVGVFAAEKRETIERAIAEVPLDLVQLHRRVTSEDVDWCPVPIVAAVRLEEGAVALPPEEVLRRCHALLWDSSSGTGRRLDADLRPPAGLPIPYFVAGGLDADNVGDWIRRLRPSGVDVASGVESSPGIKDPRRMRLFFEAVREAGV